MASRQVVDALIGGQEGAGHVPVGERDEHRRPTSWESIVVEERSDRVGGYRCDQLIVAHRREPFGTHLPMQAATLARIQLVDIVE